MTAATLLCGSCGTQLSATGKFCSECGTPLAPASKPAEYKHVTVLFADVVHSMDIATAVGAERLREIMIGRSSRVSSHHDRRTCPGEAHGLAQRAAHVARATPVDLAANAP
jgi:hypothetical protein